jgi:hypothetical protein
VLNRIDAVGVTSACRSRPRSHKRFSPIVPKSSSGKHRTALGASYEVIRKQRGPLPDLPARRHDLSQKDLKSATIQAAPCNKESQADFGPVQMRLWVSDQARNPNQHAKECQHEGHQA